MSELTRCPFCGGEGELIDSIFIFVQCCKCGAETESKERAVDALAAWNRREGEKDE